MTLGKAKTLLQKWKFKVLIDDLEADFSKAGPLEVEIETLEYHPGGAMIPVKQPGKASFPPITLELGATRERNLFDWLKEVVNVAADVGGDDNSFKRNLTIQELDRANNVVHSWRVYGAFPTKFTPGDWDGSSGEFTIRSVELTYDYYDLD